MMIYTLDLCFYFFSGMLCVDVETLKDTLKSSHRGNQYYMIFTRKDEILTKNNNKGFVVL